MTPRRIPAVLRKRAGNDLHGKVLLGDPVTEKVAVITLQRKSQHTTVRADSSASRGYAEEFAATTKFLFSATTTATIDDQIIVACWVLRIVSMQPRFDVFGKLEHYEVAGTVWG